MLRLLHLRVQGPFAIAFQPWTRYWRVYIEPMLAKPLTYPPLIFRFPPARNIQHLTMTCNHEMYPHQQRHQHQQQQPTYRHWHMLLPTSHFSGLSQYSTSGNYYPRHNYDRQHPSAYQPPAPLFRVNSRSLVLARSHIPLSLARQGDIPCLNNLYLSSFNFRRISYL